MHRLLLPLLLLASCATPPPADPRRPPAVETTGVPPVPDAIRERLLQYQNVRSASFQDWSPDGRSILVLTRFATTAQLHLVHEPGGRREQITFFDDPVAEAMFLADGSILFAMDSGGNEKWQLYRLDRAAGRATRLTDGVSRHSTYAPSRSRRRVAVGLSRPGARDTDLFILDPIAGTMEPLLEAKGQFWFVTDWSPDDTRIFLVRYVSANESYPYVMTLADRKLTPIPVPGGVKASYESPRFLDARRVLVGSDATGEFKKPAIVDIETMKHEWLAEGAPEWDVEEIEAGPRHTVYAANVDGASELRLIPGHRKIDLPLGIVSGVRFSPADPTRFAFTLRRPDAPGDVYTYDLARRELARWTWSEVGGLSPERFVAPRRVSTRSFDGLAVSGYLYAPRDARKVPVLIDIHGGPESQSRPHFSSFAQFAVNELGCALLVPNVRGSSGYGKSFLAADNAEKREDSVRDIGAFLDWIAQQPELDASRVAVMGGSYGGYMALASLVHYGERLRAGIDVVGVANFVTFLRNTSAYRQDLRRAEYGDERDPKMLEILERISPANHADRIRSALLVAHGVNDPRVPFSEAEQIAQRARGPVWTVFARNEGHGFARKENRDYVNAVMVLFLQEHLLK